MDRRRFLAALGAAGLAGCLGSPDPTQQATSSPTDGTGGTETPTPAVPLARRGEPPGICSEPISAGVDIRAILAPTFGPDWSGIDPGQYGPLAADSTVVGLAREDRARAYPLSVLWHHEVVNDAFGGPLAVTYCSLCRSGVVVRRVVDGDPTRFGVTGLLWRPPGVAAERASDVAFPADLADSPGEAEVEVTDNLVLYDAETGSYWSQLLAEAICGPRRGERLAVLPATVTTWSEWRDAHPDGVVLLPPPHSVARNPPYPRG